MPPAWRPCGLLVDRSAFGALGWLVPSKPTERARPGTARAIRAARRLLRNPLTALLPLGPRKFTKFMVVRACARGLGNRPPSTGLRTGFAKRPARQHRPPPRLGPAALSAKLLHPRHGYVDEVAGAAGRIEHFDLSQLAVECLHESARFSLSPVSAASIAAVRAPSQSSLSGSMIVGWTSRST